VQNKLSSVALTAVQTNMSLVFWQKSAEKRTQGEGSLANCSTQEDQRLEQRDIDCQQTEDAICPYRRTEIHLLFKSC